MTNLQTHLEERKKEFRIEMKIEITAKFGSRFQEETAREALMATLKAWKLFYESTHKKNRISLTLVVEPKSKH